MESTARIESGPRPLDTEEMEAWLQVASMIIKLPAALDAQLQQDAGLTHFEYATLSALSEAPNWTMHMSTLAGFANGSLSRLSHVITRLERKGWVYRAPCPEDGRFTNAILTEAGYEKVVATWPGHVENVRKLILEPLTRAQLRQLSVIGRRIEAAIDANHDGD